MVSKQLLNLALALSFLAFAPSAPAQNLSSNVLVVYNSAEPDSLTVANYYMTRRGIPAANLCAITPPANDHLSTSEYYQTVRDPIRACLNNKRNQILYIVMSYLTPYTIDVADFSYAVDSFLEDIWDVYTTQIFAVAPSAVHGYYGDVQNRGNVYTPFVPFSTWRGQSRATLIYGVWRLDAATSALAEGLVDKAIAAEAAGGISGNACFDMLSGVVPSAGLADLGGSSGDWDLYKAATFFQQAGFPVTQDILSTEFGTPPSPNCANAAVYSGWYQLNHYNDAFTWNTGAIGFHLDSLSAANPRGGTNWSANALIKGITVTAGSVDEPYLEGLPRPAGLYLNLLEGANIADAFLRNTRWLKWEVLNIGDPLYTPFPGGKSPFISAPLPSPSLAINIINVVGGLWNLQGTINLGSPAPAGGASFNLAIAETNAAIIPATVTVPAGQTSVQFPVTTFAVPQDYGVTLWARTSTQTLVTNFYVLPLVGELDSEESAVTGGQSTGGTPVLNDRAPLGDAVVSLSSSDPSISVPVSITVPAGETEASFTISSSTVNIATQVTISAAYAGSVTKTSMTVNP